MGSSIWRGMSMNGVRIGIAGSRYTEYCGADLGVAGLTICAWIPAATSVRILGAPTTDFDVYQD